MKFKAVKIISLLVAVLGASQMTLAEEMPESPKQKEVRIENVVNDLFKRGIDAAAFKLNNREDVRPFAIIKKYDGTLGTFELDQTPKNASLSVNQMALSVRRYLTELAIAQQIEASVLVMFAVVKPKGEEARQGLSFEIEHIDGVSLMRFLPITDERDDPNSKSKKLILHTEALTDAIKPATVFSDVVKAIQMNAKKN